MALVDSFGRTIRYLRVSVTDRCNLNCDYCRSAGQVLLPNNHRLLSLEEIARLVRIFTELGVERIRLTGGEPLLRKNILSLIKEIGSLPHLTELSLSTNALLLARYAHAMKQAGVSRVNISLDTLDPARFATLTRGGDLAGVLSGISAAVEAGLHPVKVNMVVMKGINDQEIPEMVSFARQHGLVLRFIETMPIGEAGREMEDRFVPAEEILTQIQARFASDLIPVHQPRGSGPARYYRIAGTEAEVGIISARSRHFCDTCNRMRLTSTGKLVLCLGREDRMDLRTAIKGGADDDQLKDQIRAAVDLKPERHQFDQEESHGKTHAMSALGG
ncbi:MAG: GTP 3',8-cyclase MoaA [Magnetococcales bacterium]|nr:GTP 3',8-cyclase MoaA [Magnetococcales bacterium]